MCKKTNVKQTHLSEILEAAFKLGKAVANKKATVQSLDELVVVAKEIKLPPVWKAWHELICQDYVAYCLFKEYEYSTDDQVAYRFVVLAMHYDCFVTHYGESQCRDFAHCLKTLASLVYYDDRMSKVAA